MTNPRAWAQPTRLSCHVGQWEWPTLSAESPWPTFEEAVEADTYSMDFLNCLVWVIFLIQIWIFKTGLGLLPRPPNWCQCSRSAALSSTRLMRPLFQANGSSNGSCLAFCFYKWWAHPQGLKPRSVQKQRELPLVTSHLLFESSEWTQTHFIVDEYTRWSLRAAWYREDLEGSTDMPEKLLYLSTMSCPYWLWEKSAPSLLTWTFKRLPLF